MWTVAGCGFCLHFVPGSDSPFLWHGDGPVETEHCHPLALLLREEHDGQNIRPCLYPRCVVYPFSFSQAGVLPYAPPVWHRLLQHPQADRRRNHLAVHAGQCLAAVPAGVLCRHPGHGGSVLLARILPVLLRCAASAVSL